MKLDVIANRWLLGSRGIESAAGARFSVHVQTGTGDHTATCTMSTGYLCSGYQPERGADHPLFSVSRLKKN